MGRSPSLNSTAVLIVCLLVLAAMFVGLLLPPGDNVRSTASSPLFPISSANEIAGTPRPLIDNVKWELNSSVIPQRFAEKPAQSLSIIGSLDHYDIQILKKPQQSSEKTGFTLPKRTLIARVFDRDIFSEDLEIRSEFQNTGWEPSEEVRNDHLWSRLQRLMCGPLRNRYCKEHHLEATDEEIQTFNNSLGYETFDYAGFLAGLRESLASPDLEEKERRELSEFLKFMDQEGQGSIWDRQAAYMRSKLESPDLSEEERRTFTKTLKLFEDFPDPLKISRMLAECEVRLWKFNKALHAQYGGTVISCRWRIGREPIEAYGLWLQEQRKAGHFQIYNPKIKRAFWHYYTVDWSSSRDVVHDTQPFRQPWWLIKPDSDDAATETDLPIK